jgi:taurine transport system substrate-binding protein
VTSTTSRRPRRTLTIAAFIAAAAATLAACGGGSSAPATSNAANVTSQSGFDTIRVGVIAGSPPGLYSAIANGFLAKQHIKVKLTALSGGPDLVAATAAKSIDIAWADIYAWSAAIEQGFKLTLLNPANGVKPGQQVNVLMAKPGSGITSAKDLAGKKIGVPVPALTTVELKQWLASQHLNPNGPKYVTVQDRTTEGGLVAQGTLDVSATSGASVPEWESQYGLKVVSTFDSGVPTGAATSAYGALLSWAQTHTDLVTRFVTAIRQGVKAFQAETPLAQNQLLSKYGAPDLSSVTKKVPDALTVAAQASDTELPGVFDVAAENKWVALGAKYGALKKPLDITPYLWPTATNAKL